MPPWKIFVDGGAGTTGLRIRERLEEQADITLLTLADTQRKDIAARLGAMQQADLSFLCLPDDAAAEIAALAPAGTKICDASTAHRTKPGWVYGLPELHGNRSALQTATRTAVPGCYASGFSVLAAPLVQMGALAPETQLYCHAVSGYSGGGRQMIEAYNAPVRPVGFDSPRAYALTLQHKHLPEMQAISGLCAPPLFCPTVADYYSGMLVSLPLPLAAFADGWQSRTKISTLYRQYYEGEALITVHPPGDEPGDKMLAANAMAGRDDLEIFILGNDAQVLLCARFDNLGKGACGAALQCMNLMLGRSETTGLVY